MFLALAALVFPADGEMRVSRSVDWNRGVLTLEVEVPLDLSGSPFARARFAAEQRVENEITRLFFEAADGLTINSRETVGEFLRGQSVTNEPQLYLQSLTRLSGQGMKKSSIVSADFKSLVVVYEFAFWGKTGIAFPLVSHRKALPLPGLVGYHTTKTFSGLVIDARGSYAAVGKSSEQTFAPAFFPRIFYLSRSGTIEPLLEMQMVKPEALERWGMLCYASSADQSSFVARAGNFPLAVTAFQVYGMKNTDIVISEESAMMLLSGEENRELLRDGKIVVIIDKIQE